MEACSTMMGETIPSPVKERVDWGNSWTECHICHCKLNKITDSYRFTPDGRYPVCYQCAEEADKGG